MHSTSVIGRRSSFRTIAFPKGLLDVVLDELWDMVRLVSDGLSLSESSSVLESTPSSESSESIGSSCFLIALK